MTRRKIEYWVIPPEADAEFVAHMEQVLDLYQRPYDPDCPVVINDNYFCRSPWWRWAGRGSTRGACDTARFPHGGRVGHGCAGSAIA